MDLFEQPLSPFVQKVKILLRSKDIPFRLRTRTASGGVRTDPAFLAASPRREVPALIDGDVMLFDSTVIMEYIDEKWPEPKLRPDDPALRARDRLIAEICGTEYEAITWGLLEITAFGRGDARTRAALVSAADRQSKDIHGWLENRLGNSLWFNGERFGWSDICVVPFVAAAVRMGIGPSAPTALAAWFARAKANPAVAITLAEGDESVATLSDYAPRFASGELKRQYRDHRLEWMMKSGGASIVLDGLAQGNIRFNAVAAARADTARDAERPAVAG